MKNYLTFEQKQAIQQANTELWKMDLWQDLVKSYEHWNKLKKNKTHKCSKCGGEFTGTVNHHLDSTIKPKNLVKPFNGGITYSPLKVVKKGIPSVVESFVEKCGGEENIKQSTLYFNTSASMVEELCIPCHNRLHTNIEKEINKNE